MRQLLALAILAVTVYGIVDCAQADARTRRNVPLWLWVVLMLLLPGAGAIIWLVISRLTTPPAAVDRTRPLAPDDDPEFLRELERRSKREPRQQRPVSDSRIEDAPVEDAPSPDSPDHDQTDDPTR